MEEKTERRIREIRQRIWEKRKNKIKIIFIIILILSLIYLSFKIKNSTIKFLWQLDTFKLKEVEIVPDKAKFYIEPVLELEKDKNLLFIDIDDLRQMILNIPEVENCKIKKIYPDKLYIDISLRKPFVSVIYNERKYIIDKNGVVLSDIEEEKNYIDIYGIKIEQNCVNETDRWKLNILDEIKKWYNYFNLRKFFLVNQINFISPNEIILYTDKGSIKIRRTDIKSQMEKLSILLQEVQGNIERWEYIDLRYKNIYKK